jgi:hypothetical protein
MCLLLLVEIITPVKFYILGGFANREGRHENVKEIDPYLLLVNNTGDIAYWLRG